MRVVPLDQRNLSRYRQRASFLRDDVFSHGFWRARMALFVPSEARRLLPPDSCADGFGDDRMTLRVRRLLVAAGSSLATGVLVVSGTVSADLGTAWTAAGSTAGTHP